jgi:hypothetical protein
MKMKAPKDTAQTREGALALKGFRRALRAKAKAEPSPLVNLQLAIEAGLTNRRKSVVLFKRLRQEARRVQAETRPMESQDERGFHALACPPPGQGSGSWRV